MPGTDAGSRHGYAQAMDASLDLLRNTDVYLIDQILKGRVAPGARIVDVGAGGGRNLPWWVANGFDVTAVDPDAEALAALHARLAEFGLRLGDGRAIQASAESMPLADGCADLVISNAVLHFAESRDEFDAWLAGTWRLVAPGGFLFVRLASTIGIERRLVPLGGDRYFLPDQSERYLVDEARLLAETERMGGVLLDPIKTTVVQGLRAMTTWVVERPLG